MMPPIAVLVGSAAAVCLSVCLSCKLERLSLMRKACVLCVVVHDSSYKEKKKTSLLKWVCLE
jgi:hypothetical protein